MLWFDVMNHILIHYMGRTQWYNHRRSTIVCATMPDETKTLDVPVAGKRYFGLSRNASYAAAKRGELPVIKIGGRLRVPVIALERMLEQAKAVKPIDIEELMQEECK
jgi:hypothetical protein